MKINFKNTFLKKPRSTFLILLRLSFVLHPRGISQINYMISNRLEYILVIDLLFFVARGEQKITLSKPKILMLKIQYTNMYV